MGIAQHNQGSVGSGIESRTNYSVHQDSQEQLFKIELNKTRSLGLYLHDIRSNGDIDLQLFQDSNSNGTFDSEDQLLATSRERGNASESISYTAPKGTYFVHVERYDPGSNEGAVGFDIDFSAPHNLGTLTTSPITTSENVHSADVFKFDLAQDRIIGVKLDNLAGGDADLKLYEDSNNNAVFDHDDRQVAYSRNSGSADDEIYYNAEAGTYFAKVQRHSPGSDYHVDYDLELTAIEPTTTNVANLIGRSASQHQSGSNGNLNFHFTYEPGVSREQMIAFEMAGYMWSQYLEDDITVNIHVDIGDDLPDGVIGGAIPAFTEKTYYQATQEALENDKTSSEDQIATSNLEWQSNIYNATKSATARFEFDGTTYTEDSVDLTLTTANAKALDSDEIALRQSEFDGYILMSSLNDQPIQWHYATGQEPVPANQVDFLSVATHEIGHVLGFVSGVDYSADTWNYLFSAHTTIKGSSSEVQSKLGQRANYSSLLDSFRYTSESAATGLKDWSIGGDPFFSIDGGATRLLDFANGKASTYVTGVDDYQASHWQNGDGVGIMVPAIAPGQRNTITQEELIAFDVIGFDRTPGFQLPNYAHLYQLAQAAVDSYDESRNDKSRVDAVLEMIAASPFYEGRGSRSTTRRQELLDVFAQEALFSVFDTDEWQMFVKSVTLNESGTAGEDKMIGNIGNDRFRGMENADILKGYEGDDLLKGNQGGDRILGGEGNDTLIGGNGDDLLKGEAGDDLLKAGAGIDVLVGGEGADTFVIDDAAGFNVIRDFVPGEDTLLLAEGLEVTIGQRNSHSTIALAEDSDNLLTVLRNVNSETIVLN